MRSRNSSTSSRSYPRIRSVNLTSLRTWGVMSMGGSYRRTAAASGTPAVHRPRRVGDSPRALSSTRPAPCLLLASLEAPAILGGDLHVAGGEQIHVVGDAL